MALPSTEGHAKNVINKKNANNTNNKAKKSSTVDSDAVKPRGDVKLPESLESLPRADHFPTQRHRWNTNEEIATILIAFDRHYEWLSNEVKSKPKSGSMLLYSRKKVRYRRDSYCWKKRKDGKTTREDHMKLKVQGFECIYGCYVHSAILPTFHRRCYWLLQNSDIVMVHYLNVPSSDGNQIHIPPSLCYSIDKKEFTKEELISQLKPMFYSENEPDMNNEYEISTAETIEMIVDQLMDKQRSKNASVTSTTSTPTCEFDSKKCKHAVVSSSLQKKSANNVLPALPVSPNKCSSSNSGNDLHCIATLSAAQTAIPSTSVSSANVLLTAATCSSILSQGASCTTTGSLCHNNGPLILNLSQLQGGRSVLILNNNPRSSGDGLTQSVAVVCNQDLINSTKERTDKTHSVIVNKSLENLVHVSTKKVSSTIEDAAADSSTTNNNMASAETLDLSHEDIQQTLSANLPASTSCSVPISPYSTSKTTCDNSSSRDPMDFIDSDINTSPVDDFVNLDAFDMFTDFPEFENLFTETTSQEHKYVIPSSKTTSVVATEVHSESKTNRTDSHVSNSNNRMDYREGTANITDFSPEWSYTEGGVKVLVTGPWYSSASPYTVLFDGVNVPTTLVQSGVLRCFCPAHEEGLVQVQVACEGFVISNSVIFEYKMKPQVMKEESLENDRWQYVDENILRVSLMERLAQIEKRLCVEPAKVKNISSDNNRKIEENRMIQTMFEDHLVMVCQILMEGSWKNEHPFPSYSKKLTILHLAAALGYNTLISTILKWKAENPSLILEAEVDALGRDGNDATPLLWACAKGSKEAALILYEYNPSALHMKNKNGETPLTLAFQNGNEDLANYLQSLDSTKMSDANMNSEYVQENRKLSLGIPLSISTKDFDYDELNVSSFSPMFSSGCSSPRPALSKLSSVDSGINLAHGDGFSRNMAIESHFPPPSSRLDRSMSLPVSSSIPFTTGQESKKDMPFGIKEEFPTNFMNVDNNNAVGSPYIDVVGVSDEENEAKQANITGKRMDNGVDCKSNASVLTLAEQIIAALPERIKTCADNAVSVEMADLMEDMKTDSLFSVGTGSSYQEMSEDFNFQFCTNSYRYTDMSTPTSSLSPVSSTCLQSPGSFTMNSPSPPPTTADFCEFFQASGLIMEKDFSNLTLSDKEQRELYEAAKIIQKAYRNYKGRKLQEEQEKERAAAVLIQSSYRRYKQYVYYKQMTKAAVLIQNSFRSYCESKSFKKSMDGNRVISGATPSSIQQHPYSRTYKELDGIRMRPPNTREGTPTPTTAGVKRTYSQRRQNQAARKIQQFMRQSKNKLQKERISEVEKGKHG